MKAFSTELRWHACEDSLKKVASLRRLKGSSTFQRILAISLTKWLCSKQHTITITCECRVDFSLRAEFIPSYNYSLSHNCSTWGMLDHSHSWITQRSSFLTWSPRKISVQRRVETNCLQQCSSPQSRSKSSHRIQSISTSRSDCFPKWSKPRPWSWADFPRWSRASPTTAMSSTHHPNPKSPSKLNSKLWSRNRLCRPMPTSLWICNKWKSKNLRV